MKQSIGNSVVAVENEILTLENQVIAIYDKAMSAELFDLADMLDEVTSHFQNAVSLMNLVIDEAYSADEADAS